MLLGTAPALKNQENDLKISYDQFENVSVTTTYKYLGLQLDPSLNIKKS